MKLWNSLRERFNKPARPTLRNRPGGLAWIRGIPGIEGRVVTTSRIHDGAFWLIDPPQQYVATRDMICRSGQRAYAGQTVITIAIVDACLEPIKDVGDEERSQEREFQPPVPVREAA